MSRDSMGGHWVMMFRMRCSLWRQTGPSRTALLLIAIGSVPSSHILVSPTRRKNRRMSYHGTHVVVIEIPEGSWGAGGQTIDTEKISKLIGTTQGQNAWPKHGRTQSS